MEVGFAPVYDAHSVLLILGSFPSVMSRRSGFYYGNPQNRFWGMLSRFFGAETPNSVEDKLDLVKRHKIALWDVVERCEIDGSSDASIRGETVVDLEKILRAAPIAFILCNGTKAYDTLEARYPALLPMAKKMPSTSPANPRYREEVWHEALRAALCRNS